MTSFVLPLLVGCATGILSSWGVGGGTLLLVLMTLFLGVEQTTARAINLLYFLPTAGMGLIYHQKNNLLDRPTLRYAIPLGVVVSAGAAFLATAIDINWLRRGFGIYLLAIGLSMLHDPKK